MVSTARQQKKDEFRALLLKMGLHGPDSTLGSGDSKSIQFSGEDRRAGQLAAPEDHREQEKSQLEQIG